MDKKQQKSPLGSVCSHQSLCMMSFADADKLKEIYNHRYGQWLTIKGKIHVRLVAAFLISWGKIVSYYVFDRTEPFSMTERRRRLLAKYYKSPRDRYVLMFAEPSTDTEYYHPVSLKDFSEWPNLESRKKKTTKQIFREVWFGSRYSSSHRRHRTSQVSRDEQQQRNVKAGGGSSPAAGKFTNGSGAGLAQPPQLLSKNSVSQRPASHFCRACGRLMLSSQRHPIRLEPCGHIVCGRCSELIATTSDASSAVCSVCGVAVQSQQPDSLLKLENLVNGCPLQQQSQPQHQQQKEYQQQQSRTDLGTKQWYSQLDMIAFRMRSLESSLEQLNSELKDLTVRQAAEVDKERQLRRAEAEARDKLERQQEEIRRLVEQRTASSEAQAQFQTQVEAKRRAIQVALAAQHSVSIELSRLQTLCGGGGGVDGGGVA
uniref:RING-type domain-containing protein n=1 Tax=Macrostomum lignano TaxID=282301 RepID=A0A1I8IB04_9PLAT